MTRRFKDKSSKQGIILVMVLLILAMAMIFISAAILLTNGTRNRLYDTAEKSQARLTATSTAEAIWAAVDMQEINDDTLAKLVNKDFNLVVAGAPGAGTATDNYTHIKFWGKLRSGSTTDYQYIYVDVDSHIGSTVEWVRMTLKEQDDIKPSGLFSNMMHSAGNNNIGQMSIGEYPNLSSNPTDNNFVIVGGVDGDEAVWDSRSGNIVTIGSNIILVGQNSSSKIVAKNDTRSLTFQGDLVLLGDYATMQLDNNGWRFDPHGGSGNFYFLGNGNTNAFNEYGNVNSVIGNSSSEWVFVNRTTNSNAATPWSASGNQPGSQSLLQSFAAANNVNLLDASSSDGGKTWSYTWNSSRFHADSTYTSVPDLISGWQTDYGNGFSLGSRTSYYLSKDFKASSEMPTTAAAFAAINASLPDDQKISTSSGEELIGGQAFVNKYAYSDSNSNLVNGYLPSGTYHIGEGDTPNHTTVHNMRSSYSGEAKYIFLNGSQGYTFYIGSTYNMSGVMFVVLNSTKTTKVNFVLENGVGLYTSSSNGGYVVEGCASQDDLTCYYRTGFVSVSCKKSTPADAYTFVKGNNTIKWSDYDNKTSPSIYIYGVENNVFRVNDTTSTGTGVIVEAYVGLYNTSYAASNSSNFSSIEFYHRPFCFYGRTEAATVMTMTNSNFNHVPYCPAPPKDNTIDYNKPIETKYSVVDVVYYGNAQPAAPY
ncbi:MAG: hypothetical protein J6Z43_09560 [Clostridiales bacterium]|nr:hypothetical protein [Clostridiales bacterium]